MSTADLTRPSMRAVPASVPDAIRGHARNSPDAPAMLAPGRDPLTYAQLVQAVETLGDRLASLGLGPGDRIAVVAENDIDGAVLLLSVLSAATCYPVNPAWSSAELAASLDAIRPAAFIIPADPGSAVRDVAASMDAPVISACRDPRTGVGIRLEAAEPTRTETGRSATASAEGPDRRGEEALLLRTSGTTAAGKIVALTMTNVVAAASATAEAYGLTPADRRLNVMPLFHVQGLVGSVIASLIAGSSVVCLPVFDPGQVLGQVDAFECTWFSASPTMHRLLLDRAEAAGTPVPASLRFVRCGSGALPSALRAELEACYGVPVIESYGMSEAHQIASTAFPPALPTAGMVPTGSEVGVRNDDGVVTTAPGSHGEIVVRGPNVISRYLWPPEANSAFVGGWLRTGDLGLLSEDGSLVITGRLKEIINCGGEKLSPDEIDEVLLQHPAVRQVAAFAVPDPVLVERPGAVVVLNPGAEVTDEDLMRFASVRLAPYKVPRRVVRRTKIPASPSGKIVRSALTDMFADELADQPTNDSTEANARPPRTAVEATLAGLWAMTLKRDAVGVEDDFLVLGGDSLTAVTLLTMVAEIFSVEFTPLDLFDEVNTVASMAAAIEATRQHTHDGQTASTSRTERI